MCRHHVASRSLKRTQGLCRSIAKGVRRFWGLAPCSRAKVELELSDERLSASPRRRLGLLRVVYKFSIAVSTF